MKPSEALVPLASAADAHGELASPWFLENCPLPVFVINTDHVVTHFNRACETMLGLKAVDVIGTRRLGQLLYNQAQPLLADLIVEGETRAIAAWDGGSFSKSGLLPDAYEGEAFFPRLGEHGRWLSFTATPLRNDEGRLLGAMETLQDITARKEAEAALQSSRSALEAEVQQRTWELAEANLILKFENYQLDKVKEELVERNSELESLNGRLSQAHQHLVQSEKMASIGQLAAGVAHEINNPMGYVFSNFGSLEKYLERLFEMLRAYEREEADYRSPQTQERIRQLREQLEIDFLKEDIPDLMRESREGISRVRKIVQDLKDFSHADEGLEWVWTDLRTCIDSTINIVANEFKYKADLTREYGEVPDVECLPSQINQVVMNLLVNAAQAMGPERGRITVRTGQAGDEVWFEVEDTGAGIPKDNLPRIFNPFFTTKPVGQGTGLGLSLSNAIVQKHNGRMEVDSEVGKGTRIRVCLPRQHTEPSPTFDSGVVNAPQ